MTKEVHIEFYKCRREERGDGGEANRWFALLEWGLRDEVGMSQDEPETKEEVRESALHV